MNQTFAQRLTQLIEQPTPSNNHEALQRIIEQCAEQIRQTDGVNVEMFKKDGVPSLLAYNAAKRPTKFKVILNGHLDVVPAKPEQYKVRVEGDKLYGRGALDMKAAALIFLETFCEFAPKLPYPIGLQLVADEELGGQAGTGYQLQQGVDAEFALGGEFTQLKLNTQSKGICWAHVTQKGDTAHSAYLWQGNNAVNKLTNQLQNILNDYPVPDQEQWVTTVNVARMSTDNQTMNKVPDSAKVSLDVRFVPEDPNFASSEKAQEYLQSVFPEADIDIEHLQPGQFCPADDPYIQKLAQSFRDVMGSEAEYINKHGTSDLRYFSFKSIPSANFGLKGDNIHGDGEYLDLTSVEPFRAVIEKFLRTVD